MTLNVSKRCWVILDLGNEEETMVHVEHFRESLLSNINENTFFLVIISACSHSWFLLLEPR